MDQAFAVIRAIGSDRIGVVDDITSVVEEASCNIEESKMSVLGGEFAVMMLVEGDPKAIEKLASHDFSKGPLNDFSVDVVVTEEGSSRRTGVPYMIETVSLDSPGIVHAVTSLLSQEKINIEELETDAESAPFTGSPMFNMRIRITLEGPKRAAELQEILQQLAYDRDLDIAFRSLS
mgnify:CR=1 FL=1